MRVLVCVVLMILPEKSTCEMNIDNDKCAFETSVDTHTHTHTHTHTYTHRRIYIYIYIYSVFVVNIEKTYFCI